MKNLIYIVLLLSLSVSFSQDGTPDISFGNNGIVVNNISDFEEYVIDAIEDNNRNVIVIGNAFDANSSELYNMILSFNENGEYNSNFGDDGIILSDIIDNGYYNKVLLQNGEKILISSGLSNYFIKRLLPNGNLDNSFANNGYLIPFDSNINTYDFILDSENSIYVIGRSFISSTPNISIKKFLANGSSDIVFGDDGIINYPIENVVNFEINNIQLSNNEEYLIVSSKYGEFGKETKEIIRFLSNGNIDSSFGNNGRAIVPIEGQYNCSIPYLFNDNAILVNCSYYDTQLDTILKKLLKLSSQGNLLINFGENGYLENHLGELLQPNNRLIINNNVHDFEGGTLLRLKRFFGNGTIDPSFQFNTNYSELGGLKTLLLNNGKILVVGNDIWYNGPDTSTVLLRYNNNPLNNPDFETNSISVSPNPSSSAFVIHSKTPFENEYFQIFDITGKHIKEGFLSCEKPTINLSHFDTGIYFLKFENSTIKLLKN